MEYTVEQVVANLNAARERAKPAILADVPDNGHLLTAYIKRNNLEPTADGFYKAIVAMLKSLRWVKKPAQLVVQELANKPVVTENPLVLEKNRTDAIKAADQKTADDKERSELIAQCEAIIAGYLPMTRDGRRVDYREQDDARKTWGTTFATAKTKSLQYLRDYTKNLVIARDKRYKDQERHREGL